MGVPYEIEPMVQISLPDANPVVVEIPWPHRSIISKIIVVTIEGVGEAFTVALYNHQQVSDGIQASDSIGPDVGKIPDDCFRVTPDIVAGSNGKVIYFSDQATGGYGYVFFSHQPVDDRRGQRASKLYVKITPVTSAPKKVALIVGGMKEVE